MAYDMKQRLKRKSWKLDRTPMCHLLGFVSGRRGVRSSSTASPMGLISISIGASLRLWNLSCSILLMLGGKLVSYMSQSLDISSAVTYGSTQLSKLLNGLIPTLHSLRVSTSSRTSLSGMLNLGNSTYTYGMGKIS